MTSKNLELPPIRNGMSINEMFVDGTPDGTYALRILKAYRRRCDERWEVHGLSPERTLIYDLMNEHQEKRAKELDAAIEKLSRKDDDIVYHIRCPDDVPIWKLTTNPCDTCWWTQKLKEMAENSDYYVGDSPCEQCPHGSRKVTCDV